MAWTIGGTPPNLTAVGDDAVAVYDEVVVLLGSPVTEAGIGILDSVTPTTGTGGTSNLVPDSPVDPVEISDRVHVVLGRAIPDTGIGITDVGGFRTIADTLNDGLGITGDPSDNTSGFPPTSVPATASGSLTLSGSATGADANPDAEVVVTLLPAYRAVRVTVNTNNADEATVYRDTAQTLPEEVRLAVIASTQQSLSGVDYEAPMDVPLTYSVEVSGVTFMSVPITIPSYGRDWYCALGQPSISRAVTVESFPEMTRTLGHSRVRPLTSRNPLIITHIRTGLTGTLTLLALTAAEAQAIRSLIDLSPLFQFKAPADRGLPDGGRLYLLAGDYREQRVVQAANEPTRRFIIDVVEVDRPPLVVPPPVENTWQDWDDEALWNSTWDAWRRKSWLDILVEDLTLTGGS